MCVKSTKHNLPVWLFIPREKLFNFHYNRNVNRIKPMVCVRFLFVGESEIKIELNHLNGICKKSRILITTIKS